MLLPVKQIDPLDRFLKKAKNEFVYRLTGQCSDFSLQVFN